MDFSGITIFCHPGNMVSEYCIAWCQSIAEYCCNIAVVRLGLVIVDVNATVASLSVAMACCDCVSTVACHHGGATMNCRMPLCVAPLVCGCVRPWHCNMTDSLPGKLPELSTQTPLAELERRRVIMKGARLTALETEVLLVHRTEERA
ncbi:unnamed protein product [Caretta caretta]